MVSKIGSGDRILTALKFRSMVMRSVVLSLAVLMAMVLSRPAHGQGTTTTTTTSGGTTTTTTTYPDGTTQSQDTTVTGADGSKFSETHTDYDENGRPISETQKIFDPKGNVVAQHDRTWVYDDKGRLLYFEVINWAAGSGVGYPTRQTKYRIRKKYKDDKDTEGTTTSEEINDGINGTWRDFNSDGDSEPSMEPLQPLKPKTAEIPKGKSLIPNATFGGEAPAGGTKTPEQPKNAPSNREKPKAETPPASETQTPEKPSKAPLIQDGPIGGTGEKTSSTGPAEEKTIAIAMPANAQPGDTITGAATDDPTEIAEMQEIPGIHIALVPVTEPTQTAATPMSDMGGDETLSGVVVQVNGQKQPADKPLVATLGPAAGTIAVELLTNDTESRVIGEDSVPVSAAGPSPAIPAGTADPTETAGPQDYEMPPVSKPGAVEVIHGAEPGNANDMQIAVDGEPAQILTATPRSVFWRVPADLPAGAQGGAHTVVFTRSDAAGGAPKSVTFPLYGAQIQMSEGSSKLVKGQSNPIQITVSIPPKLQASAWQSGIPPTDMVNLKTLDDGKSGLKPPKPNEEGFIAVLIEDETPDVVRLGKKNTIVLQLHQKDFVDGKYTYNTTLNTIHAGAYLLRSRVVAFLKDAQGQASAESGN
jgi:hypothetical protein